MRQLRIAGRSPRREEVDEHSLPACRHLRQRDRLAAHGGHGEVRRPLPHVVPDGDVRRRRRDGCRGGPRPWRCRRWRCRDRSWWRWCGRRHGDCGRRRRDRRRGCAHRGSWKRLRRILSWSGGWLRRGCRWRRCGYPAVRRAQRRQLGRRRRPRSGERVQPLPPLRLILQTAVLAQYDLARGVDAYRRRLLRDAVVRERAAVRRCEGPR